MLDKKMLEDAISAAGITLDVDVMKHLDAPFDEIGLDSLDSFNLFLELEAITGIKIPDEQVDKITNFKEVIEAYS
jgi:acyl carrier protein